MIDKQKALLAILIGSLLGAGNAPVIKFGVIEIPPLSFSFIRFLIASILITPFILKDKEKIIHGLRMLFPMTLFATFNIIFFVFGVSLTTATIAQLLYAAAPFLTGIIAYKVLGEKLSVRQITGIIIGFIGIVVVVLLPLIEKENVFSGNLLGNILIGAGVIFWSFYLVFSKKAQNSYSPFVVNSVFIIVTTIILFPLFIFDIAGHSSWFNNITGGGVTSIIYVAIAGTIGTHLLNQYAIKHGGSVFASTSLYLVPIFVFFTAYLLLGERLTQGVIVGGVLALLGVFLVTSK